MHTNTRTRDAIAGSFEVMGGAGVLVAEAAARTIASNQRITELRVNDPRHTMLVFATEAQIEAQRHEAHPEIKRDELVYLPVTDAGTSLSTQLVLLGVVTYEVTTDEPLAAAQSPAPTRDHDVEVLFPHTDENHTGDLKLRMTYRDGTHTLVCDQDHPRFALSLKRARAHEREITTADPEQFHGAVNQIGQIAAEYRGGLMSMTRYTALTSDVVADALQHIALAHEEHTAHSA